MTDRLNVAASGLDELGLEAPFTAGFDAAQEFDAGPLATFGETPFAAASETEWSETIPSEAFEPGEAEDQQSSNRIVVSSHPLIRSHRGTAPDLILKWNRINGASEIDVVVHFHGYSGRKKAMRIDHDKETRSGLDFSDPAGSRRAAARPPHASGSTARQLFWRQERRGL